MKKHLLEFFHPSTFADDTSSWEYQRIRLFIVTVDIIISISLLCTVIYFVTASWVLGAISFINVLFGCAILLQFQWSQKVRLPAFLLIVHLFIITVVCVCITGGIHSFFLSALFAPSILAIVIFNRRVMMWSGALSLVIIGVFMIFNELNINFPVFFAPQRIGILSGVLQSFVILGILTAFYYSELVRQKAFQLLQGERDSVQEKIQEATNALKEQQIRILNINNTLEQKNTQLEIAIQEADNAKKLQTEFLRNVSHEVRTPLTGVLGFAEIVTSRLPSEDTVSKEFMQQIHFAGQNLMDIFSNILTLAGLEAGTINYSRELVQIHALVDGVEQSMRPLIEQKGLMFRASIIDNGGDQEYGSLDMQYTREIMRHLLSNALKFTEKGMVSLTCEILTIPQSDMPQDLMQSMFRITVTDTGIGIDKNVQGRMFTPFFQSDGSKTRAYQGLGLGLAITKRLVNGMSGYVRFESEVGHGTTFIVELPMNA